MAFCVCVYDTVYILYYYLPQLSVYYKYTKQKYFVILTLYHLMKYMFFIENVRNL